MLGGGGDSAMAVVGGKVVALPSEEERRRRRWRRCPAGDGAFLDFERMEGSIVWPRRRLTGRPYVSLVARHTAASHQGAGILKLKFEKNTKK